MTATTNNIKIEPLQVWYLGKRDEPMRRIKILAKHPEKDYWIYEELVGGKFNTDIGRIGLFPTQNLIYMFRKELGGVE